jgi:hypothetical protein
MKELLNLRTDDDGMVHLSIDDLHVKIDARVFDAVVDGWIQWRQTDLGKMILKKAVTT